MKLSDHIDVRGDCSNLRELPTLRFLIDGQPFELPPQAYVMRVTGTQQEVDDVFDILPLPPVNRTPNTCVPAIMPFSQKKSEFGPVWILGMPFFRYYHTTFDRKHEELRFAAAGPHCEAEPLPPLDSSENAQPAMGALLGTAAALDTATALDMAAGAVLRPPSKLLADGL